jgi:carbamoyl-phosphate synthase small subunit
MTNQKKARIVFRDGTCFEGKTFSLSGDRISEIVFNTAMTGYQEVLTDPSYLGQMVVLTYPEIGNYGINEEDVESRKIFLEALIVKSYNEFPSNYRSTKSLKQYLEENNILGIEEVDTRALTLYLRDRGVCNAIITTSDLSIEELVKKLNETGSLSGNDYTKQATTQYTYEGKTPNKDSYKVAIVDCGLKLNILRLLEEYNCHCTIFPSTTHAETIIQNESFDGLFISNGPGDPEPALNVQEIVKSALGKIPIFGICMGHQILGQVLGLKINKLPFGHHGVNHPIKNLQTGIVEITSQNHNFVVETEGCDMSEVEVTHVNLNDQTIAGIRHKRYSAFSVQYHPESSPGPHDSRYLFANFTEQMEQHKNRKERSNVKVVS